MTTRAGLLSRQLCFSNGRFRLVRSREAQRRRCRLVATARVQPALLEIFSAVSEGRLSPLDAAQTVQETLCTATPVESAFPKVVNGTGKRPEWTSHRIQELLPKQGRVLVTGVDPVDYAAIRKLVPGVVYHAGAKTLTMHGEEATQKLPGSVGIVTDAAVSAQELEELQILLEFMGCYTFLLQPLAVSDLPTILNQLKRVAQASAVVVVYGEEQALPDVIAGSIDAPVISVPVGESVATHSSLSAANFQAAAVAVGKILNTVERLRGLQESKGGPYEDSIHAGAPLDEQIQDALDLLGEQTSLQRVNNVVTSEVTSVERPTDASAV